MNLIFKKSGPLYVLSEDAYSGEEIKSSARGWKRIAECMLKGHLAALYWAAVTHDIATDTWIFFNPNGAGQYGADHLIEEGNVITIPDSVRPLLAHQILATLEKNSEDSF